MHRVPLSVIYLDVANSGMLRVDNVNALSCKSNSMFANFSSNPIKDILFVSFLVLRI